VVLESPRLPASLKRRSNSQSVNIPCRRIAGSPSLTFKKLARILPRIRPLPLAPPHTHTECTVCRLGIFLLCLLSDVNLHVNRKPASIHYLVEAAVRRTCMHDACRLAQTKVIPAHLIFGASNSRCKLACLSTRVTTQNHICGPSPGTSPSQIFRATMY